MEFKKLLILSVSILSFSGNVFAIDECKEHKDYIAVSVVSAAEPAFEIELPLGYRLKQWIKVTFNVLNYNYVSKLDTELLKPAGKGAELVTWRTYDSRLSFDDIFTTKKIPSYENSILLSFLTKVTSYLSIFGTSTDTNLLQAPDDIEQFKKLYPTRYQLYLPLNKVPAELIEGHKNRDILGALALKGTFGRYIQYSPTSENNNLYKIDFSDYESIPVKDRLSYLGGIAILRYNSESQRMETISIEYKGETYTKDSSCQQWDHKQRIMLATIVTDTPLVHHLLNTHMAIAGTFCAVNNYFFKPEHPLRVLMFPHQHKTLLTNNNNIQLLFSSNDSFFPSIFSYEHKVLLELFKKKAKDFKISSLNPLLSFNHKGMADSHAEKHIEFPYASNAKRLWNIIANHVNEYVNLYFPTEKSITDDQEIVKWFEALDQYIPNGIRKSIGGSSAYTPNLTGENLCLLITTFIYSASVEHEFAGSLANNYFLWQNFMPSQVPLDSTKRLNVDVIYNAWALYFLVATPSILIETDFSALGLGKDGKQCFRNFRAALKSYQQELELKELNPYTVYPSSLDSAVSK